MSRWKKENNNEMMHAASTDNGGPLPGTSIRLDAAKYRPLIADRGLTEEEKRDFIETVWAILYQAMKLGIRLEFDPEICGNLSVEPEPAPHDDQDAVLYPSRDFIEQFNETAAVIDIQAEKEGS